MRIKLFKASISILVLAIFRYSEDYLNQQKVNLVFRTIIASFFFLIESITAFIIVEDEYDYIDLKVFDDYSNNIESNQKSYKLYSFNKTFPFYCVIIMYLTKFPIYFDIPASQTLIVLIIITFTFYYDYILNQQLLYFYQFKYQFRVDQIVRTHEIILKIKDDQYFQDIQQFVINPPYYFYVVVMAILTNYHFGSNSGYQSIFIKQLVTYYVVFPLLQKQFTFKYYPMYLLLTLSFLISGFNPQHPLISVISVSLQLIVFIFLKMQPRLLVAFIFNVILIHSLTLMVHLTGSTILNLFDWLQILFPSTLIYVTLIQDQEFYKYSIYHRLYKMTMVLITLTCIVLQIEQIQFLKFKLVIDELSNILIKTFSIQLIQFLFLSFVFLQLNNLLNIKVRIKNRNIYFRRQVCSENIIEILLYKLNEFYQIHWTYDQLSLQIFRRFHRFQKYLITGLIIFYLVFYDKHIQLLVLCLLFTSLKVVDIEYEQILKLETILNICYLVKVLIRDHNKVLTIGIWKHILRMISVKNQLTRIIDNLLHSKQIEQLSLMKHIYRIAKNQSQSNHYYLIQTNDQVYILRMILYLVVLVIQTQFQKKEKKRNKIRNMIIPVYLLVLIHLESREQQLLMGIQIIQLLV